MPLDPLPPDLGVFTCTHVLEEGRPILHVAHDADGDWQFLCGLNHADLPADLGRLVSLARLLDRDPTLLALTGKLYRNWSAWRDSADADWQLQDGLEDTIRDNIAAHGWHVILSPADAEGPAFAYSIGLFARYGQPEILISGLAPDLMHGLINDIGKRIKAGENLVAEKHCSALLQGHDCVFRPVARSHYPDYLGYARRYYEDDRFPAMQCFWSDKSRRFPWDPEFDQGMRSLQPDLA